MPDVINRSNSDGGGNVYEKVFSQTSISDGKSLAMIQRYNNKFTNCVSQWSMRDRCQALKVGSGTGAMLPEPLCN